MRPRSKPSGEASLQRRIRAVRRVAFNSVLAATLGLVPAIAITAAPAYAADGDITLAVTDQNEGTALTFSITRAGDMTGSPTTIRVTTGNVNDTATVADSDYTPRVNFAVAFAGANTEVQTVTVPTTTDTKYELDETVTLTAVDQADASKTATRVATILNNDALPTYTLTATPGTGQAASINENAGVPVIITATLSNPSYAQVSIPMSTANGTAIGTDPDQNGPLQADYTPLAVNAKINIPAGDVAETTSVAIVNDVLDEVSSQTFTVNGGTPTNGASVGNTATVTVTIVDDEATPTISIAGGGSTTEGLSLDFPLTLSGLSEQAVDVRAATTGGTATSAVDYTPRTTGTAAVAITPGQTSGTVSITTINDNLNEGTAGAQETVVVTISSPNFATLGTPTSATGSINDATPKPHVTITPTTTTVAEGNTAPVNPNEETFTATLSGASSGPVTVDWAATSDTAVAGKDFTAASGTLTFTALEQQSSLSKTFKVAILADTISEPTERFNLTISNSDGTLDTSGSYGSQYISIADDDGVPTFSVANETVSEGTDAGTTSVTYTVTLSKASSTPVNFTVAGVNGTAKKLNPAANPAQDAWDNDFSVVDATAVVAAEATTGTFTVAVTADSIFESAETATVQVTPAAAQNVAGGMTAATLTITNDDAAPTLTLNSESGSEGTTASFGATVAGTADRPFTVQATAAGMANGSSNAAETSDFVSPGTVTFTVAAGTVGPVDATPDPVTFRLNNDDVDEPNETIKLAGAEHTSTLGVTVNPGWITINDDQGDLPPTVSIDDEVTVDEDAGTVEVPVELTFDGSTTSTENTITVGYSTTDGTAKGGADLDYTEADSTLTFAPTDPLTKNITVTVNDDEIDEADEDFEVRLGTVTPVGTMKDVSVSTVTITDDEATVAPTLFAPPYRYGVGYMGVGGVAKAGATVELWVTPVAGGAPQHVLNTTAAEDGTYRFVRWISQGYKVATKANGLLSSVKVVYVKQKPVMKLNSARPGMVNVFVTADPAQSGRSVLIQRWLNGQWRTVAARTTNSNGMTGATLIGQGSGKWVSYRAFVSGTPSLGILANYAVIQQIKVK